MDVKYTVAVKTARGGFEELEDAKAEAIRLAKLNTPETVEVENQHGRTLFFYNFIDGQVRQAEFKHSAELSVLDDS